MLPRTLGGTLDLLDAPTHTVVLPHALGYDQPATPGAIAALSRGARRRDRPGAGAVGASPVGSAPRSLAELGMKDNEIPRITELAIAVPYAKPPTDHPRRCRGGAPSRMARRTAPHLLVAP